MRVAADNERRALARIHELDQTVRGIAQIDHAANIEQLFQSGAQNFGSYEVQSSLSLIEAVRVLYPSASSTSKEVVRLSSVGEP